MPLLSVLWFRLKVLSSSNSFVSAVTKSRRNGLSNLSFYALMET
ncbi:uncharacterized protein METZ01_LOCUS22320 [marine metagenome]|uniref:Uncharacterized protein n=1 Tax=marine metagenome TaxID=408172 RepID=A0A381PQZ7_9ZZZZ